MAINHANSAIPKPSRKRKVNHSRKKRTRQHRSVIKRLDDLARAEIMARDFETCQRCGKSGPCVQIQWSHVHSRRHHCIRWDPDNSKAMCRECHCWWTNNPGLAFDWFSKKFPERWERITRVLQANPKVKAAELLKEWGAGSRQEP